MFTLTHKAGVETLDPHAAWERLHLILVDEEDKPEIPQFDDLVSCKKQQIVYSRRFTLTLAASSASAAPEGRAASSST